MCFLSRGLTIACLNVVGKFDSEMAKLMRVVIGCSSTGRQDLRRLVGIQSRAQVESVAEFIASLTSSRVAG